MSSVYDCVTTDTHGRKSEPYAVTESDITNAAQGNELVITENGVKIIAEPNGTKHVCTPRTYPNRELWAASFYKPECKNALWKLEEKCDVALFMVEPIKPLNDPYYHETYHVWNGNKWEHTGLNYMEAYKKWNNLAYEVMDDTYPIPVGKEVV